jgi:hypothetical protein
MHARGMPSYPDAALTDLLLILRCVGALWRLMRASSNVPNAAGFSTQIPSLNAEVLFMVCWSPE